jgi:hypothetical protein
MTIEETRRMIAEQEARECAVRTWAAEFRDTPLGRVAGTILAEDDTAGDLSGGHGPDYYSGLAFAIGAIMNEVLDG